MTPQPTTLPGRRLRMEPLTHAHAEGLAREMDVACFAFMREQPIESHSVAAAEAYIDSLHHVPNAVPFAAVEIEPDDHLIDGAPAPLPVAVSLFADIRPEHRGLEIGYTWIAPSRRGGFVNPEMKLLLLRHAFDTLGMIRVMLKTDVRNARSQAAIAKLGAKREGVLRKHQLMPDGHIRDTVVFSITDDEWPNVKAGLIERLGYEP
ncbi:MAG: GNAT family protein [Planctomycetota bacterium]